MLHKQLVSEFPSRPEYRMGLAQSYYNLGIFFGVARRWREAEAAYRDAVLLYKQLAADFPSVPDYENELALTLSNLGWLANEQQKPAEAARWLVEALPHHQATLRANPRHPSYRQGFCNYLCAQDQER